MGNSTLKILMTGAGAPGAPSIVKCIKNNGERKVNLIGVDANEKVNTKDLFDRVYRVPKATEEDFIDSVKEICLKEKIDVILPIVTKELNKFAKAKGEFKEIGVKVLVLNYEVLEIVNNKVNLFNYLKNNDLEVPNYYEISNVNEIAKKAKLLGYPEKDVCIKMAEGNGSRGVRILTENISKFDNFFNEKPNSMFCKLEDVLNILSEKKSIPQMMVMESLPNNEWGVDAIAVNGEIINILCRKTTKIQHSITMECEIAPNKTIEYLCREIVKRLNITGSIGFDFKEDSNGHTKILEINPRLTATVAINNAAGINFPWMAIKLAVDGTVEKVEDLKKIRMIRRYEEYFYEIEEKCYEK